MKIRYLPLDLCIQMGDEVLDHHAHGIVSHTGYLDRISNGTRSGKSSNWMRWDNEGCREINRRPEVVEGLSDYGCGSVAAQLDSAYGHRHCLYWFALRALGP